eukprot:15335137-Ditylum_brightwellii.AAC.1
MYVPGIIVIKVNHPIFKLTKQGISQHTFTVSFCKSLLFYIKLDTTREFQGGAIGIVFCTADGFLVSINGRALAKMNY